MEIDDRQNMLITQNLKESNKELWNRLTSMPQDIMNLNNQLDDAKQEISDLKEYISNLNVEELKRKLVTVTEDRDDLRIQLKEKNVQINQIKDE